METAKISRLISVNPLFSAPFLIRTVSAERGNSAVESTRFKPAACYEMRVLYNMYIYHRNNHDR